MRTWLLVRKCLGRCFAFDLDVVYSSTVSWEFVIAQENSATAAECRAKEFGYIVFTILDLDQGGQVPCAAR